MKFVAVFALLALLSIVVAEESVNAPVANRDIIIKPVCPCKCIVLGKPFLRRKLAKRQCLRLKFKGCIVEKCKRKFRRGFWCCTPPKPTVAPSSSASTSATPSVTPSVSASPSPICPCKCRKGRFGLKVARKECFKLKPYCKVGRCGKGKFGKGGFYCCFP